MVAAVLPPMQKGSEYNECIQLTGTGPFSIVSKSVPHGTASIVGSQLCINVPTPSAPFDLAVEVKGSCVGCKTETITASIGLSEEASACVCKPAFLIPKAIPILPAAGQQYFAAIHLGGTAPFELCGASVPRCLTMELKGNLVEVRGKYDGLGPVTFSFKNACSCDCIAVEITDQACVQVEIA
jgi:hypothetical protein